GAPANGGKDSIEGNEQCDDGNLRAGDGCSPSCEIEPSCRSGECIAQCGDGILYDFDGPDADALPDEQCDDGNAQSGDGCSATCTIEVGYQCPASVAAAPEFLDLPVIYRDMEFYNAPAPAVARRHPDFEIFRCNEVTADLLLPNLVNGLPVYNPTKNGRRAAETSACSQVQITSASSFSDWYQDIAVGGVQRNNRVDGLSLRLLRQGDGSYFFSSSAHAPFGGPNSLGGFYPIRGKGWNVGNDAPKNGGFTTELRYAFTYDAAVAASNTPPRLDFSGDDDVWVFINGKLALDIGGLHSEIPLGFALDTAKAAQLGLVDKRVYEIALFHAERMSSGSNFKLTLRGFEKKSSVCSHVCGDGVKTREEQCDLGADNASAGTVAYGGCTTSCTLGAYCGDRTTQPAREACDDGINRTAWTESSASTSCGPGCKKPAFCGDGEIQGAFGERCDNGAANTDAADAYNSCKTNCKPGPRCGDKTVQAAAGEQCDNGFNVSTYVAHPTALDCAPQCKTPRSCGDGTVDYPFEQCDRGAANDNAGGYGSCTTECTLGPRCGDGTIQTAGGETCDDGNRVNGDGCSAACLRESNGPN
ncbi:MAG: DUF4215 domain-containing protein, partial [Proteobacteria bacterium]